MSANDQYKNLRKEVVEEVPWGIYVWQTPDGEVLGDGDNIMQVFCMKNDRAAIHAITEAARGYGYPEGKAVFMSGHRPVTDEEYDEQVMRERLGLVPDPLDYAALRDKERADKKFNGRA
jgi:hypothetical protein